MKVRQHKYNKKVLKGDSCFTILKPERLTQEPIYSCVSP